MPPLGLGLLVGAQAQAHGPEQALGLVRPLRHHGTDHALRHRRHARGQDALQHLRCGSHERASTGDTQVDARLQHGCRSKGSYRQAGSGAGWGPRGVDTGPGGVVVPLRRRQFALAASLCGDAKPKPASSAGGSSSAPDKGVRSASGADKTRRWAACPAVCLAGAERVRMYAPGSAWFSNSASSAPSCHAACSRRLGRAGGSPARTTPRHQRASASCSPEGFASSPAPTATSRAARRSRASTSCSASACWCSPPASASASSVRMLRSSSRTARSVLKQKQKQACRQQVRCGDA